MSSRLHRGSGGTFLGPLSLSRVPDVQAGGQSTVHALPGGRSERPLCPEVPAAESGECGPGPPIGVFPYMRPVLVGSGACGSPGWRPESPVATRAHCPSVRPLTGSRRASFVGRWHPEPHSSPRRCPLVPRHQVPSGCPSCTRPSKVSGAPWGPRGGWPSSTNLCSDRSNLSLHLRDVREEPWDSGDSGPHPTRPPVTALGRTQFLGV